MRGNCYVTSEALYHLLGGKEAGWQPMRLRHEGDVHWYLFNTKTNQRLDATRSQFKTLPDYYKAVGAGFLTKSPSRRARTLMQKLVWQEEI
jgi:hypothetical protein